MLKILYVYNDEEELDAIVHELMQDLPEKIKINKSQDGVINPKVRTSEMEFLFLNVNDITDTGMPRGIKVHIIHFTPEALKRIKEKQKNLLYCYLLNPREGAFVLGKDFKDNYKFWDTPWEVLINQEVK